MTKKQQKSLTFWKKIRFKYKLSFLNENTLEEVFSFRLSRLSAFVALIFFAFLLIATTSVVIIKTPIRNYLPGYLDAEIRKEIAYNILKADSLEQLVIAQTTFINHIKGILRGDQQIDSVKTLDSVMDTTNLMEFPKSDVTHDFVQRFEKEERYNLGVFSSSASLPDNIVFYRPVKGVVSAHFDVKNKHFGTDIAADPRESVLATLKGTVIFAGFDANAGYVMQIQHRNGFISIYKHNALLLKNMGDEVNVGEAIALVGNTGQLSTGTHLHFELWYKGSPVDPEEFIVF